MDQIYNKTESKENPPMETEILSCDDLVDFIYKGQSFPQDNRFMDFEKGGVFKYFCLEDIAGINPSPKENKLFPVAKIEGMIVGLAELEKDPNNPSNFWIKFISVDPKFQGRGYASALIRKIFDFANENNYSLEPSFYSEEGKRKLEKVIERIGAEKGVKIHNLLLS